MPILLFGSENWILAETHLHAFIGELAKRALKWPMHLSTTSAVVALDLETIRSRILCWKLCFLKRLLEERATGVGAIVMRSLSDDVESLCLVKECRELESYYGTIFKDNLLADADSSSLRVIKKSVRQMDREKLVHKCSRKSPTIADIVSRGGSWPKLWDSARHLGSRHTTGLRNLSRLMGHHGRGPHPCPLCGIQNPHSSVIDHILSVHHTDIQIDLHSTDQLLSRLVDADVQFAYRFWKLFKLFWCNIVLLVFLVVCACGAFVIVLLVICVVCPMLGFHELLNFELSTCSFGSRVLLKVSVWWTTKRSLNL